MRHLRLCVQNGWQPWFSTDLGSTEHRFFLLAWIDLFSPDCNKFYNSTYIGLQIVYYAKIVVSIIYLLLQMAGIQVPVVQDWGDEPLLRVEDETAENVSTAWLYTSEPQAS